MPSKPKTFEPTGKTAAERRRERDADRGSARSRGYTTEWDRYSKERLRENPTCARCRSNGVVARATVTDHIKPARWFPELFWDQENHQSLCVACNAAKAVEDGKLYGAKDGREGG